MKFGFRKPSVRKSFAARTSLKRRIRHSLGLKAPRGWGWLTNPRKAAYNRVYYRRTFGWRDLFKTGKRRTASQGCLMMMAASLIAMGTVIAVAIVVMLIGR
jgi:hypothetical protein